jgi:hypothetical protein
MRQLTATMPPQPSMRIENVSYQVFTKVGLSYYFNVKTILNVKGFIALQIFYLYDLTA